MLARSYKGKEADQLVTRIDPGAVSLAAQFGDPRDHAGADARHEPVSFLAFVARTRSPLAPPGKSAMSAPR